MLLLLGTRTSKLNDSIREIITIVLLRLNIFIRNTL